MKTLLYFILATFLLGASCSNTSASEVKTDSGKPQTSSSETPSGDKYEIKLTLEKGKIYTQTCQSKTMIFQTMSAQQVTMAVAVETKISYKVLDVKNDEYEIEAQYDKLQIIMAMQQTEMLFTTGSNETDHVSQSLDALRNKPFKLKINSLGKVKEITGFNALIETVVNDQKTLDQTKRQQLRSQLLQAYGESTLKGNIELCTAIFPSQKVSKGEHWNITTQLGSAMAPTVESDLELKDISEEYWQIASTSKIATKNKDAFAEMNGVSMTYDMKGNMSADIKLDKKSGWTKSAKFTQTISGEAYVKANDKMPDMTIPMTANIELSFSE